MCLWIPASLDVPKERQSAHTPRHQNNSLKSPQRPSSLVVWIPVEHTLFSGTLVPCIVLALWDGLSSFHWLLCLLRLWLCPQSSPLSLVCTLPHLIFSQLHISSGPPQTPTPTRSPQPLNLPLHLLESPSPPSLLPPSADPSIFTPSPLQIFLSQGHSSPFNTPNLCPLC